MAIPERDTVYSNDGNRTIYARESNGTAWFVGIIVVLALLAIGYLVFSANSGPSTSVDVNNTPAVTAPADPAAPAPMTSAPADATAPAAMAPADNTVAPAANTAAPAATDATPATAAPANAAPATDSTQNTTPATPAP